MKKWLALILAGILAFGLVGCARTQQETDEKGSVYWLNFKPESDEALKKLAKLYTEKTGVQVKVETAAAGAYNETLTAEMDKGDASPTIFVVGNQAAVDTWSDYCMDLKNTDLVKELNTDDYMLYDKEGKLCSIGYCYECYGIMVNTALLQKAGYAKDYIKDFATLSEVAKDVHKRADELGFDAFTSGGMDSSSSWRFTGHLINLAYYYESKDDPETWKKAPAEIKGTYMKNYKALYDLMVENSLTDRSKLAAGGLDANEEFAKGKAMFYANGNWEWASLEEKGMKAEDVTMIPYYCGVKGEEKAGLNSGTENYWAVNSEADKADQKASLDFMKWVVTDKEASAIAVETFGVMPYKNAATSSNPFLKQANAYAEAGHYNMPWVTNFQPNVESYRNGAVSALNAYNANPSDATWKQVETAFVDGWKKQYQNAKD